MIIRMDWPFANDYLDFFLSTSFFSIFLWSLKQISYVPPKKIVFSFKTFLLLLQIFRSRFNLVDFSRTFYSCSYSLGKQNSCMSVLQIKSFIHLLDFFFSKGAKMQTQATRSYNDCIVRSLFPLLDQSSIICPANRVWYSTKVSKQKGKTTQHPLQVEDQVQGEARKVVERPR